MRHLRVLLAEMPPLVLRDILAQITSHQPDMMVVGQDVTRSDLAAEVRRRQANVAIVGLDQLELPEICTDLLSEFPDAVVVGIAGDGRYASLNVANIGPNELINAVRAASGSQADASDT